MPPHLHARYQGAEACFTFDGGLMDGDFPAKQRKLVAAWSVLNADKLEAGWELARNKQEALPHQTALGESSMKYNVSKAWAVDDTTLYLEFDDGRRGTYDMSKIIGDGIFKKLSDPTEFRAARSDGFTVVWPCGLDIAPEELYENCVAI